MSSNDISSTVDSTKPEKVNLNKTKQNILDSLFNKEVHHQLLSVGATRRSSLHSEIKTHLFDSDSLDVSILEAPFTKVVVNGQIFNFLFCQKFLNDIQEQPVLLNIEATKVFYVSYKSICYIVLESPVDMCSGRACNFGILTLVNLKTLTYRQFGSWYSTIHNIQDVNSNGSLDIIILRNITKLNTCLPTESHLRTFKLTAYNIETGKELMMEKNIYLSKDEYGIEMKVEKNIKNCCTECD